MSGTAVLICVGDELLNGRVADTNSPFMRDRLDSVGWRVEAIMTVGDRIPEISRVLRCALQLGELIIITGGLGPTSDDITREAVAEALGRKLVTEESVVRRLKERFASMGFEMPESNLRQAQVIEGVTSILDGKGTAPGLEIKEGDARIYLLPGVPGEMRDMMDVYIIPALQAEAGTAARSSRMVKIFGREASVGEEVDALLPADGSVQVAYLVNAGMIEVHLKTEGEEAGELAELLDKVMADVEAKLAGSVVTTDDRGLPEVAGALLRERRLTLSVAESCTGGMLGEFITQVPGSSAYFLGGVVSYAVPVKQSLLHVSGGLIEEAGVVSEAVAVAMARGARELFSSDLALGITGVAGPDGGTDEAPVGTVCLALATPEGDFSRRLRLPGDRELIRRIAANAALFLLKSYLSGEAIG